MPLDLTIDQLLSFFPLSPDLMAVIGEDGRFLEWNGSWEKILGFSQLELKQTPFLELVHAQDQSRTQLEIHDFVKNKNRVSFENRFRCKNQTYRWIQWTWNLLKEEHSFYVLGRDITELIEMKKSLEESRGKFFRLAESAKEGVAIHEKGIILEANMALARLLGFADPKQLVGLSGMEFAAPEYRQLVLNNILTGYEQPYEIVGMRKDGSRFDCLLSGKPVLYEGRQVRVSTFLDITPLKKREQELFESQELFRKLAEASKDGIVVSEKGKILMANPALAQMFGYGVSEMIGRNAVEFTAPEFHEMLLKKVMMDVETPYEIMGLRKDKSRFPLEITARVTSYQGRSVRVAFFRDITQRKKIEEEVQRQKDFSQNLINSSIDGMMAFDREYRYTLWNQAMERLTGHSREEVLGQCAFDVFPFLKQIGQDRYFDEALQGKTAVVPERPYRTPAGRQGFFEARYMPLKTIQGQIIGGLGIIREVTDRKNAVEALRRSEINLKAVFNNTLHNIVLLDLEARILDYNLNAAAFLKEVSGLDVEKGKDFFQYVFPSHLESAKNRFRKALQGEVASIDRTIPMTDGSSHWYEVSYNPVFGDMGEIEGVCFTCANIDERKEAEESLRKSEASLRAVFNSQTHNIILIGKDRRIQAFNEGAAKAAREVQGVEYKVGADFLAPLPEKFKAMTQERFDRVLAGESLRLERAYPGMDGMTHWYDIQYDPVRNEKGDITGICLTNICIDERKKAEEALRQSEMNLKGIFNSVSQNVILLTPEGVIRTFNKMASDAFQKILSLGLKPGILFENYIRQEDQEAFRDHLDRAGKGERVQVERIYLGKDGVEHWYEYTYNPVFDDQGKITGVCFVSSVIDERKKAEKELQVSEEKFRRVFEDSSMAMAMINDYKFLKVNRAFQDLLGYPENEIIGKTLFEVTHPDDLAQTKDIASKIHQLEKDSFQTEKRYLRKDGQSIWANVSGKVIRDEAGMKLYSLITVENITDRKTAQEALRRSEADLRAVFNSGSQVTILINRDGRIQGFNKSAAFMASKVLGRGIEIGMLFAETLPQGASLKLFQESFSAALEGKETRGERPIVAADGVPRWVEVNYQPAFNDKGGVEGVCFSLAFIDDRKKTEKELLESQERFERLAQLTQEGILIHENSKVVDVNPALAAMLGYTHGEMNGKNGFDFLSPECHEVARRHMREGSSQPYEAVFLRKDGSTLPVEVQGRNFHNKGKDLRVLSIRDLTWRKEAERILTESEDRYRRLVELSPEAVVVHAGGKILYVNSAGLEMFGATGQKVEGRSVMDVLHPESREMALARVQQIIETGKATDWVEQKLIRLNGEEFLAETKGTPFLYQGVASVLTIVRDITEKKKNQQTLLRYERLAGVGQVIAAIAHEIRNPLAVVSGMSQILKAKLESRSEYSQELATILGQTDRLRLFMNDILDYSREMEIKKGKVDIQNLLERSLVVVQAQVGSQHVNIEVKREWEKNLPDFWADEERLEQVLVNLILNAYQSMEKKGTLTLSGRAQENWVILGVQDDGPGISEADLPHLFEPFFTTKKHGSGLGLPISQKIVEAHGGKIEVQRTKPHGILFTIQLPTQKI